MNELMKAFGRLSGEILNATGEATKGFAQGFKESYNPDAFRINPKTKEEFQNEMQIAKKNTEMLANKINKLADKMASKQNN